MNDKLSLSVFLVIIGTMVAQAQDSSQIEITSYALDGESILLNWNGSSPPYQVQSSGSLTGGWTRETVEQSAQSAAVSFGADVDRRFFRVVTGDGIIPTNSITLPTPGTTLTAPLQPDGRRDTDVIVSWELGGEVPVRWWVYGESELGVMETRFYNSGSLTPGTRSRTISGIPFDGSNVTIRLWWEAASGGWTESRVIYGSEALAQITLPAPGARLSNSGVFALAPNGVNVAVWWVYVGSTIGGNEYSNAGRNATDPGDPVLSYRNVPSDNSNVYVRLFWQLSEPGAEFESRDYQYLSPEAPTSP